jgi:hypothetical protein
VWKKRLFLFWPEFFEKQRTDYDDTQDAQTAAGVSMSELEAIKYWEIRLAWSEYVDGKWSPKQVSKESIRANQDLFNYSFYSLLSLPNSFFSLLSMLLIVPYNQFYRIPGMFILSDIQSKVDYHEQSEGSEASQEVNYSNHFMNYQKNSELYLDNNTFLKKLVQHKLLYSNNLTDFKPTAKHPFFFSDAYRTYFVRPVEISIPEQIRHPENANPPNTEQYDPNRRVTPDLIEVEIPFVNTELCLAI